MANHSNKHIREAIRYAESKGWTVAKAGPRAHTWGTLYCSQSGREGCKTRIMSTHAIPRRTPGTSAATWIAPARAYRRLKGHAIKTHDFTLVLTAEPDEEQADQMYGAFNDGTISTIAGLPQIHFHRESPSLEEAIRTAIRDVLATGFNVERVELAPSTVLHAS